MRTRLRPTQDAVAFGVFLVAALGVGYASGDNLLLLVAAPLVVVAAASLTSPAGFDGVEARRRLPDELVARQAARGALEVRATAEVGPLTVVDPAAGVVSFGGLGAGAAVEAGARWRLDRRGRATLPPLEVRTSGPFGMVERTRVIAAPDEVVVWPEPAPGGVCVGGTDLDGQRAALQGVPDDVVDLRPYRPGDPLRDLHGPTSARAGQPMVVVRRPAGDDAAWIVVPAEEGEAFERAIREAAGALTDAWLSGRPVGLRLGEVTLPPRTGPAWRRRLLEALALARPPGEAG